MLTNNNWAMSLNKSLRRKIGTALSRWNMINEGDRVLVGLSGGKDSLLLLHALLEFSRRSPVKFSLSALTVRLSGMDTSALEEYCSFLQIPFSIVDQDIMGIIEVRHEKSPCSFCANMRRGILSRWASENGCSKLALGHTLDDAVETFFMNILHAGRARSFQPVAHMSRTNVTVIRPLVLSTEAAIIDEAKRLELPVVASSCPFAGHTERQNVRELLSRLRLDIPDLYAKVINALANLSDSDAWINTDHKPNDEAFL